MIPQEILDLIVDHLHNEPTTLNTCCLVYKVWVPCARKHLFANVAFLPSDRHVPQWREAFPDPATSPAHNIRTLSIRNPTFITTEDTDTLLTFCGITCLTMNTDLREDGSVSLAPFYGFSPVVRSLHLTSAFLRNSEIVNLICFFPLLEDLTLVSHRHIIGSNGWEYPPTSPRLTGTLELHPRRIGGIVSAIYLLLHLPNGCRFKGITVPWQSDSDVKSTMDLVSNCSNTLEVLDIENRIARMFSTTPVPNWDLMFK